MAYIFLFTIWSVLINDFSDLSLVLGVFVVISTIRITNLFFKNTTYGTIQILVYSLGSLLKMYKNAFAFLPLIILKRYSGLSHIDVKGKSDFEKAAIANSISLTPKTLVLFEEDDKLIVHKVSSNPEEAHRADNIWKDDII
ncbi:hypothetical protein Pmob_0575 [Petrotoga mobilis SJ95]|uniref:Cation antiporter n=1 Tax=Petrotoga mobilis (strain DSM 10674 / SJ95) TaxID=403833 RepID=A9BH79_PETMO|nr:Na+/H+ antiporter subunit E [Petrotoga mobilis]ABX31309.1 hypothetical protein Pmob_0575 [Petrotoga mobilis SJ95]